jgi:hypothetical protein
VVRYFYPSDASASLDWNRFAIHGAKQVRGARDTKALQATLQGLVALLGPGIEISQNLPPPPVPGSPDDQLIALPWCRHGWFERTGSVQSQTHAPVPS